MPRPDNTFQVLLSELRNLIVSSIRPGELMPSHRELARTYGVAPDTIHRAIRVLAREKLVRIRARIGCIRAPEPAPRTAKRRATPLRIGIISRRNKTEWLLNELYDLVFQEAARRGIELVEVPNPRRGRTTPARSRIELTRIPWNSFDVGMLFEVEDALTLSDPLLKRRTVLAVDQDATAYGIDSVSYNDWQAGQLAARHLFELGHRRFAVSDEANDPEWPIDAAWTDRRLGFESELARLGGIIRPAWRVEMPRFRRDFEAASTYRRQIAAWLAAGRTFLPTALFSVSMWRLDEFATALNAAGLRIPRDLSVVGLSERHEHAEIHGLRVTHITVNTPALVTRAFDAAEELAQRAGKSEKRTRTSGHLFSVPVLLAPGDSTAGLKS